MSEIAKNDVVESLRNKVARQEEEQDVRPLRSAYTFAFAIMATAHIALLWFISHRPDLSFSDVFANIPSIFSDWTALGDSAMAFVIFKYDLLIYVMAQFVYCIYVVVELRGKCLNQRGHPRRPLSSGPASPRSSKMIRNTHKVFLI